MTRSATAEKVAVPITVNGTVVGPRPGLLSLHRYGWRAPGVWGRRPPRRFSHPQGSAHHDVAPEGTGWLTTMTPGAGADGAGPEFMFAQAGEYLVLVHDAKYSDQGQNFYCLKIGLSPYAEFMFPLGWTVGLFC